MKVHISLGMIVLNSMKNMVSHFFMPPQHASQYTLTEKLTRIHWLLYDNNVHSLNSVKIPTVRSLENFKKFDPTSIF